MSAKMAANGFDQSDQS